MEYEYITTIGQDSHRFETEIYDPEENAIMLGGYPVPFDRKFSANSDGDVILHAITNAVSGLTGVNILGGLADKLCLDEGIKDSRVYLREGLKMLGGSEIIHVSLTVECLRPKLKNYIPQIKESIASILSVDSSKVGLTATTGEGLTGFGRGEGIQVFAMVSFRRPVS